jgi:hypothetical protein
MPGPSSGREVSIEELVENPTGGQLADHFAKESGRRPKRHAARYRLRPVAFLYELDDRRILFLMQEHRRMTPP